jgi:hypothetical protein
MIHSLAFVMELDALGVPGQTWECRMVDLGRG